MLAAYFDDSGTHDSSDIIVIAGFIASDDQWNEFDAAWSAKLAAPLPGKPPLARFHMAECESRTNEFQGYTPAESAALIHDLRQIIIDSKLVGRGIAVERKAWDRIMIGPRRQFFGDAERFCFHECLSIATNYAWKHLSDRYILIVFDNRPHREHLHRAISDVAKEFYHDDPNHPDYPKIIDVRFLSSQATTPLQAADMLAWENYRHAVACLKAGGPIKPRAHLQRLLDTGLVQGRFADEDSVKGMAEMFKFERLPAIEF